MNVMEIQRALGVAADGLFGPVTANALASKLINGELSYSDPVVAQARQLSKDHRVRAAYMQKSLMARLEPDPAGKPGKLRWRDGGTWKKENLRKVKLPGVTDELLFYAKSIPALICAFGEVEARLPGYLGKRTIQTVCTRCINWVVGNPPSMHSFGVAFDIDLDLDGKLERVEQLDDDTRLFVEIMESWGFRWLRNDHMHLQYAY